MSELVLFAGGRSRILVSGEQTQGAWTLLGNSQPIGNATPPHLHRRETEVPFVLSGELTIETGARTFNLTAGETAVLPKDQPHRLSNAGPAEARYLLLCAPAGFERFTIEVGEQATHRDEPARPMSDEVRRRLATIAPLYGIELLDEKVLHDAVASEARRATEIVDVLGIRIELLAETGPGDAAPVLVHNTFPAGVLVPLHRHPEPECFVVLDGELAVHVDGVWHHIGSGTHIFIPGGARHAVRNPSAAPTTAICATTRSLVNFLYAAGAPAGSHPPGPPSPEQMHRLFEAFAAYGHTLFGPKEQAAAGISLGDRV